MLKISRTITGLQPLNRKLKRDSIEERAEIQNRKKNDNPHRNKQVARSIENYIKSDDRIQCGKQLEEHYKKLANPQYVPSSSCLAEWTEFLLTEFHISTPLRPKALYDFPLSALLFRALDSQIDGGISIPLTWDKIFDMGRYLHINAQDRIWLNMYLHLRNRYFSRKPCPYDSGSSVWYMDKSVNLFLSTNSSPIDQILLKRLNAISIRDHIIEKPFITPYDCRRYFTTYLHYHEDERIRSFANTAAGHGGEERTSHKMFKDFYNQNQVSTFS